MDTSPVPPVLQATIQAVLRRQNALHVYQAHLAPPLGLDYALHVQLGKCLSRALWLVLRATRAKIRSQMTIVSFVSNVVVMKRL